LNLLVVANVFWLNRAPRKPALAHRATARFAKCNQLFSLSRWVKNIKLVIFFGDLECGFSNK
jgi:hypothetical protein